MKNLELPGLNPSPKPVQTAEEEPFWVWCPPAFEVGLHYEHPDFPEKFINRQLLVKNCRKPETDVGWRLYEAYFLDELELRKINISREKIRKIIERFHNG